MKKKRLPIGYWTYERCKEEVLKYKTTKEFRVNNRECYKSIKKNGWWGEICGHLIKSTIKWDKIKVREEALKYKKRVDFQKNSTSAYASARKNGWIDEVCAHMEVLRDPTIKIGNRYGYIIITGITSRIRSTDNKKINSFEYLCDCGNTGSFGTTNLHKRNKIKFKTSCGCNKGGYRDTLLLNQSGFNICSDCKQTLPISEFSNNRCTKNGLQVSCKDCKSKTDKDYRNNPRFRERILNRKKEYYLTIKKDEEKWGDILKKQRENRDYSLEYVTMRLNPIRRSKDSIRKLIIQTLKVKNLSKSKIRMKTEEILCCSFTFFKEHIENQFTENMCWLNHGEWHLDHIIPMDVGETVEEIIKLNHWTNFQPLWSKDNYSKHYHVLEGHYDLFYKLLGREYNV